MPLAICTQQSGQWSASMYLILIGSRQKRDLTPFLSLDYSVLFLIIMILVTREMWTLLNISPLILVNHLTMKTSRHVWWKWMRKACSCHRHFPFPFFFFRLLSFPVTSNPFSFFLADLIWNRWTTRKQGRNHSSVFLIFSSSAEAFWYSTVAVWPGAQCN